MTRTAEPGQRPAQGRTWNELRGRAGNGHSCLAEVSELLLPIDPDSIEPLHRQLYRGLRESILTGRLAPGVRVPSSRRLADHLAVSRSTILVAFEQLVAEGYLVGTVGSGTRVADQLPDRPSPPRPVAAAPMDGTPPRLATRAGRLQSLHSASSVPYPRAFWAGVPPVDEFPRSLWSRLAARRYRCLSPAQLYHGPAAGYPPLREAIAAHVAAVRGGRASPEQVIVVSSAQEAVELACRVLLDHGDAAWLEDPSWSGIRGALIGAGARLVPLPVDREGLVVEEGLVRGPEARLACVAPSHQYPAGVSLSLPRRLALLAWAERQRAWILEDDYDSEFRFEGPPLTAMQGLDQAGRVVYIGTFNKTVFPALRIGFVIVPPMLVDPFLAVRRVGAQHAPTIDQMILTDFLVDGHYARHMRRMRTLCRDRRDLLLAAARVEASDLLEIGPTEGGLHAIGWLREGQDDVRASAAAARAGVQAAPLSGQYLGACLRPGLILGYAGYGRHQINTAMRRLAEALRAPAAPA